MDASRYSASCGNHGRQRRAIAVDDRRRRGRVRVGVVARHRESSRPAPAALQRDRGGLEREPGGGADSTPRRAAVLDDLGFADDRLGGTGGGVRLVDGHGNLRSAEDQAGRFRARRCAGDSDRVPGPLRRPCRGGDGTLRRMDAATVTLPPITDGAGVLIVLNAQSGTAVVRADPRPVFAERLPAATVHELAEGEDLADAVAGADGGRRRPVGARRLRRRRLGVAHGGPRAPLRPAAARDARRHLQPLRAVDRARRRRCRDRRARGGVGPRR